MKTIRFTVPPTAEMGSYSGNCSASYGETFRQCALWDYNSARAHDGLPPLSRMPAGTRYHAARAYYVNTSRGETVDEFDDRKEARRCVGEYRTADPSARYWISSRPYKGWKDEPASTFSASRGGERAPLNHLKP